MQNAECRIIPGRGGLAGDQIRIWQIGVFEIDSAALRLCVETNPAETTERIVRVGNFDRINRIDRIDRIEAVAGWAVQAVVGAGDDGAVLHLVRQLAVDRVEVVVRRDARNHCGKHVAASIVGVGCFDRINRIDRIVPATIVHRALCIVHYIGEVAREVVGVGGEDAARPEAGGQFAVGRVGVGWAEAVGVELVRQKAGRFVVEPVCGVPRGVSG